ncbi:hypothetical protein [Gordonia iterans]
MELQRPRESLHRLADCVDDRWRVRRWIISVLDEARHADAGDGELLAAEWQAISPKLKRRIIRRAAGVGIALGFGSKFLIGLETFVLVLLAFTGGQLTLRTEASHPSFWEMLVALVIGTAVALLFSLLLLRPQVRWFVDDGTTDRARRRAVARVPMQQVGADLAGWAVSFGVYALIAEVSPLFLATVGGAFAFAAASSCAGAPRRRRSSSPPRWPRGPSPRHWVAFLPNW